MRASVAGMAVLVLGVLPAAAGASTVERVQQVDPFGQPYDEYHLVFTGAAGEANDLEIRLDAAGVTFRDAGRALEAKGCEQVDPSTARCGSWSRLVVTAGDGDDVVRLVDERPEPDPEESLAPTRIDAGPGADTIAGGVHDDVLVDGGGGEADRFSGGGGADRVSYEGRATPVQITVGAPSEDVLEDITTIEGGSADDVLVGDAGPNSLRGGPRGDTLRGEGGDDSLDGGGGDDRVDGGPGDDELAGDTFVSGAGRDLLVGGAGDDLFDLGAADDEDHGGVGGPTYYLGPDGERDTVRPGRGYDTAMYRSRGDAVGRVEAESLDGLFHFQRVLRRASATTLRLRVEVEQSESARNTTRIALAPRGSRRPRLTRPIRVDETGTITLRLKRAGRRYLRGRRALTLTDGFETIDVRVARRR